MSRQFFLQTNSRKSVKLSFCTHKIRY